MPRVTCEIRHFEGGSSVVLASPEGTHRFREAKLKVWKKHAALLTNDTIADAFERQKRRAGEIYSQLVETKGQVDHSMRDAARLEREKAGLISEIAGVAHDVNAYMLRVRELEGHIAVLSPIAASAETRAVQVEQLERALRETHEALERSRVEIDRLNSLLDMIYRSRTWKMHTFLERVRGRG